MTDACPHCPDGHDRPLGKPWGVYVSPIRDGDRQPTTLHVAPSNGSHVAESDAEWLRGLIRGERASASEIIAEILAPLNGRLAAAEAEGLAAHQRAEQAEAEAARLRAGESAHPAAEGVTCTPAEWIHRWNRATADERLARVEQIFNDAETAFRCQQQDHDTVLQELANALQIIARIHHLADVYNHGANTSADPAVRAWAASITDDLHAALSPSTTGGA